MPNFTWNSSDLNGLGQVGSIYITLQFRYRSKSHGHNVPDESHVKNVMKHISHGLKNKCHKFIIASDSKQYCKEHYIDKHVVISPFANPMEDFALLASCDHMVMTQGTFGWWIGWIVHHNGGNVYYFKHPFVDNTRLGNLYKWSDVYLKDWIPYTNTSVETTNHLIEHAPF